MDLAAYAMRDTETAGRRHTEPAHPYRSEYQRDRDRIVHTKAFRRLENKTQVFDLDYSDHFRNRLTHTLEVSQIARTVARALSLNEDLCEVLALSHDIGHPPFSHEGEKALDRIMQRFGSGFDHNLHGLRIVEDFEEKYAGFRGLNLTFEVREGIVKHSRDYSGEEKLYVDITPYLPGRRPPLEAQLIDLADEIAYNTADLDDGYDSGFLSLEQMVEHAPLFGGFYRRVEVLHPSSSEKLRVAESVRCIINELVSSLIGHSRDLLDRHRIDSVQKVRDFPERLMTFEAEIDLQNRQLKDFLHAHLYSHRVLRAAREKAQHLVEALFEYYLARPKDLPAGHYARVQRLGVHQVVCDYIAGMTDKFAYATCRELYQREPRDFGERSAVPPELSP